MYPDVNMSGQRRYPDMRLCQLHVNDNCKLKQWTDNRDG